MKKLILITAFVSLLFSCSSASPKAKKDTIIKCCGGLNLSALVDQELVECGVIYGGSGFKRRLVNKSDIQRNNIVRCARKAMNQGRPYLVQYNISIPPDFEEITFVIFEPNNEGIIVTYSSDGETNWSTSVKRCSHLILLKKAYSEERDCNSDPKLET